MYSSLANTTFSYLLTIEEIRNKFEEDIRPSWIKLSTITVISSFIQDIDIPKVRNEFKRLGFISLRMQGSKGSGFQWKMKETTFYNQVTLVYTDCYSCKSLKLFPNGSIQIAGCSDLFDCKRIINQIAFILKKILNIEREIPTNSFKIVMINTNFSLNYNINLLLTANVFKKNKCKNVSFDPDRYSAVKIKFRPALEMKEVTVSIFSTGKIIITGAETLKEIAFAFNFVNEVMNSEPSIRVSKKDEHEMFDIFMGYKMDDWLKFLKSNNFSSWFYTIKNPEINF